MARPPRACWVHKPWHKWRVLPRPKYGPVNYDPEEMEATPEAFEHKLAGPPPKLWVAWLYRVPEKVADRVRPEELNQLRHLFGTDLSKSMNKMRVFKNTPYWNNLLWRIKSYIEIRPITFPHGEPTEADINHTTLLSSGECIVNKDLKIDEEQLTEKPEDDLKNFPRGYIPSKLLSKFYGGREIQEDDVWGNKNFSRF